MKNDAQLADAWRRKGKARGREGVRQHGHNHIWVLRCGHVACVLFLSTFHTLLVLLSSSPTRTTGGEWGLVGERCVTVRFETCIANTFFPFCLRECCIQR